MKSPAPSPCETRAGRGLGRARSIKKQTLSRVNDISDFVIESFFRCSFLSARRPQRGKKFAPIAALEHVEQHRSQNDGAEHDLLRVAFHALEIHPILNDGDD